MKFLVAVLAGLLGWTSLALAQESEAKTNAAPNDADARMLAQISSKTPKTVVALFDISRSMSFQFPGKQKPIIEIARPFAQDIVNETLHKGDRFVLYVFDKEPRKLVDATLNGNREALRDQIPSSSTLSSLRGTNIRWAHFEGLKTLEQEEKAKRPAFLVVLSDGFHDSPDASDPNYRDFYIPQRLDKLPDTPKAREYARLAQKFKAQSYGVGVQISQNGWVEEKPASGEISAPTPAPTFAPLPTPTPALEGAMTRYRAPLLAGIVALALALLGLLLWNWLFKPIRVGLGQPTDARKNKKFPLKHGGQITLGGVGAGAVPKGFPIPETRAPVATIARSGQNFSISPVANQPDGAKIWLNGQPLDQTRALSFGDSLRIDVPDRQAASVLRSHLLRFDRAEIFK